MVKSYGKLKSPRDRKSIEESYASILAPFAVVTGTRRDVSEDKNSDNRSVFQRDRDRIIHSEAFRRLMYKTQVFVNHEGDHFRTRLTHTLEVSQFARGVCKSLALNEDLAEAISLGHDLGHTPFGHAVEEYFNTILTQKDCGGFYHNEQSVRVVDFLEKRREEQRGLNLSDEVREGILKHTNKHSGAFPELSPDEPCSHLEGQIVNIVDTIAYVFHDLEDAIKAGIVYKTFHLNPDFREKLNDIAIKIEQATDINLIFEPYKDTFFIRNLIHYFIVDLTNHTFENIKQHDIETLEDVRALAKKGQMIVGLSEAVNRLFKELRGFIFDNIYKSETVSIMDEKAVALVKNMFEIFLESPALLPSNWKYKYDHISTDDESGIINNEVRVICDYISCMTDRFALDEHERLFNPRVKL